MTMPEQRNPNANDISFRQRILDTVRKKPETRTVFQPRLESWIYVNGKQGTLPEKYRNASSTAVYADLNCSFRPYHFFNRCLQASFPETVTVTRGTIEDSTGLHTRTVWKTPVGEIEMVRTRTSDSTHVSKFPVSSPRDMKVLEYILMEERFSWDEALFGTLDAYVACRATAPAMYLPRVNVMRLSVNWMGFEQTNYALFDHPSETRHLISVMNDCEHKFLEVVASCPVELINYGDNLDGNIVSPPLFEEFILPQYARRAEILKPHGKFLYSHWDGSVRNLLPFAQNCHLDGIEALTPAPQGDVTLEEIKDAVGDKLVLVDVLPMLLFMPGVAVKDLERETHKVIDMFAPNIILGVSDEISPVCDIEKVRRVAEIVNSL